MTPGYDVVTACRFEELGHTAEIGLRVYAGAPAELFACAAHAMFSLLRVEPDRSAAVVERLVSVESIDMDSLLIDWLNELLYLHETTGVLFSECVITHWTPIRLEATVAGSKPQQLPSMHIKAATYHQLQVTAGPDGWKAQVYFDI
jgi:SHS2 domain-containing protein